MRKIGKVKYNGKSTADLGVIVSGEASFDAAAPDYTSYQIPGKNGDLMLSNNRFLNIDVTYPAFIPADFEEKVQAIRNWMRSARSYARIEDNYDLLHFRMGMGKDVLTFEPSAENVGSNMSLVFDCKPQRFLYSGEEEKEIGVWGPTQTASGDMVSFEDEGGGAFKSLSATITPTQDLHGYEYPWPAGGGKNLIWSSTEQGGISGNGGNTTNSARCRTDGFVPVAANTIYTASVNSDIVVLAVHFYESDTTASHIETYVTGGYRTLTFTTPETATHVRILYKRADNQDIIPSDITEPMLEVGDTATTFAPYANICPITGRTEVTACMSGRNLIVSWNASSRRSNYIRVDLSNGPYVLSYQGTETSIRFWLLYYDANLNYKGRSVGALHNNLVIYGTSNIFADGSGTLNENNVTFIVCQVYTYTGPNLNDEPLQFEAGDIVTPYAGRTGTTRSLTWQSEAGEVYSGTVDIVTGLLSVKGIGKVFDGTESWTIMSSDNHERTFFRYVDNRGACPIDTDKASSHFRNVGVFTTNTAIGYHAYTADSQPTVTVVQIRPGLGLFTTADWKAWLAEQYAAGTPVKCWWTIEQPITFQLTGQQINTLLGTNNVWADVGAVTAEWGDNPFGLYNPTLFDALPLIKVKKPQNGCTVTVNGTTMTCTRRNTGTVIIDCELMNVYYGATNLNSDWSKDFPVLSPGENSVTFSGADAVTIIPRWWEL